jgi:hypothetical protein
MAPNEISSTSRSTVISDTPAKFTAIAVQTYGSAGSQFLHSLFDNHPNVLNLPGTLGVQYYVSWARQVRDIPPAEHTFAFVKKFAMEFFHVCYDAPAGNYLGLLDLGEKMDENAAVDRTKFESTFDQFFDHIAKDTGLPTRGGVSSSNIDKYRSVCLKATYLAYAHCLGQDLSLKKYLVYAAHGAPIEDLTALSEDFGSVFFVHMVREPINNFDSVLRLLTGGDRTADPWLSPYIDPFFCVTNHMFTDHAPQAPMCGVPMYQIYPYPVAKPDRSIAVRLEDLHREPEKTLRALCRWLGLPWSDTMMQSTFAGKTWWNRPGFRRVTGFNTSITARPPTFGKFDQWRLSLLAAPIREKLAYSEGPRDRLAEWTAFLLSLLLPFGLEYQTFSFKRFVHYVARLWPRWLPGSGVISPVLAVLFSPIFLVWEYVKRRVPIVQGFFFNRSRKTAFVALLDRSPDRAAV